MGSRSVTADQRGAHVPASATPGDYYSILVEAIERSQNNSAHLRALVYERARFNLKREALFGYSNLGLADLLKQINELELAIARIEANAIDGQPNLASGQYDDFPELLPSSARNSVLILPPTPPIQQSPAASASLQNRIQAMLPEALVPYWRPTVQTFGVIAVGLVLIVAIIVVGVVPLQLLRSKPALEIAQAPPVPAQTQVAAPPPAPAFPFPLPTSFGVFAVSDNKLFELEALSMKVPDSRIALSPEITKPSNTTIASKNPSFIIFRRDLVNNAPGKVSLRVVAQMVRETKFVAGKATTSKTEGSWRIRKNAYELKVSPIAGHPEMVLAHSDDDLALPAGRYVLVLNGVGYDFTIEGPMTSLAHCLESFEASGGLVFNECRSL